MKGLLPQITQEIMHSPKAAGAVATATVGTGVSTLMQWLPIVAGTIASVFGALASLALIISIWRRDRRESIKLKAELSAIGKRRHDSA